MATTTTTTRVTRRASSSALAAELLVDRCVECGIPDSNIARRVLHATLAVLGSRLTDDEAAALSSGLPGELARIVDQAEYDRDFDAAELYALIATRTQAASLGDSREQTDVALRVIGETIDDDVRRRLCRVLPEPIARRIERRAFLGEPPPPHPTTTRSPQLSTLATGRPGSRHPLSESSSLSKGQTHSVARSEDPHADTKLSSARGLTQERLGETLAEGRSPSPDRTIAEANDHD